MVWNGGSAYVLSDGPGTNEIWASATPNFLPLTQNHTTTKLAQNFANPAQFLSWVCQQHPAGTKLYVVRQQSTYTPYNGGTYDCP